MCIVGTITSRYAYHPHATTLNPIGADEVSECLYCGVGNAHANRVLRYDETKGGAVKDEVQMGDGRRHWINLVMFGILNRASLFKC